jgi:polyvinyl alcohol dehydrogenase (cytochrome)
MRARKLALLSGAACALLAAWSVQAAPLSGQQLYDARCAACHEHPQTRVPARAVLAQQSPAAIVQTMTSGAMKPQAAGLTDTEIAAVAEFLTGKPLDAHAATAAEPNRCPSAAPFTLAGPQWLGWGRDQDNSRFQPAPGLALPDVARLRVKWALGYRGTGVYGQPAIAGGRLFVASMTGRVYALDAHTGCVYWTFDAEAPTRTAITIDAVNVHGTARLLAFVGDDAAHLYALDARSGALVWKTRLDGHPSARITGAPALFHHRLYVPLASLEEVAAMQPAYGCCTFRGSLAAVDSSSGRVVWQTYTTATPKPYRKSTNGTQLYGPAGVSIWHTPLVDPLRHQVYAVTGNSYTEVPADMSDALVAFDLASGAVKWIAQVTRADNFVVGCRTPPAGICPYGGACGEAGQVNCPRAMGPDYDFGGAPILRKLATGRTLILAAQKSGAVFAFDPERRGAIVWQTQTGQGSDIGGSEWGPAADEHHLYVATSDVHPRAGHQPGGLTAIEIASGRVVWHADPPTPVCSWGKEGCSGAQSQAVSVIPGVVFSGSQDGHLRGYSSADGSIVWDFDTARSFATVNAVPAQGGSLDQGGAVIVDGMLFVNSGYGKLNGKPGNVLLAFSPDGR